VTDVEITNLTSTTIWTKSVQEQWPCEGEKRNHAPWSDDHKITKEKSDTNGNTLLVAISLSVAFCVLMIAGIFVARSLSSSNVRGDFSHIGKIPRDEEMNGCGDNFDSDDKLV
jgi:hypothetical protein